MDRLEIEVIIITNTVGGINENLHNGDLIVIEDIIKFRCRNIYSLRNYCSKI